MSAHNPDNIDVHEMYDSLTGFEEESISAAFGQDLLKLSQGSNTKAARALVFVLALRKGMGDDDAMKHAMSLTNKQVDAHFEPDDLGLESGEGSSPPESGPTT